MTGALVLFFAAAFSEPVQCLVFDLLAGGFAACLTCSCFSRRPGTTPFLSLFRALAGFLSLFLTQARSLALFLDPTGVLALPLALASGSGIRARTAASVFSACTGSAVRTALRFVACRVVSADVHRLPASSVTDPTCPAGVVLDDRADRSGSFGPVAVRVNYEQKHIADVAGRF